MDDTVYIGLLSKDVTHFFKFIFQYIMKFKLVKQHGYVLNKHAYDANFSIEIRTGLNFDGGHCGPYIGGVLLRREPPRARRFLK